MTSSRRWILWLPVTVVFGVVIVVFGFGIDVVFSSPANFLLTVLLIAVGIIQGMVVGLVAILAAKIAGRVTKVALPGVGLLPTMFVHAVIVGGAVAVAVIAYLAFVPSRTDGPSTVGPVVLITLVAAASAAASVWVRPTRKKTG